MEKINYTAFEVLEIKGSFMYFILLIILTVIASSFQLIAGIQLSGVVRPLIPMILAIILSYLIYLRKKKRKSSGIYPWITSLLTISIPVLAKYNYVKNGGWTPDAWTFAAESYNTSIMLVILIVMLQLLYSRRLFIIFATYGFINWVLFFVLAHENGATMYMHGIRGGELVHGVIILREVFYMIVSSLIAFTAYRNIPIIHEYDSRTRSQRNEIRHHLDKREEISNEVKNSMGSLFHMVEEQDQLVINFNSMINEQSSTFEEIAATLEELEASAEGIHQSSSSQVEGNIAMEIIIQNFKSIKVETKENLDTTYNKIGSIMEQSNTANEKIGEVEKAINRIKEQGEMIRNTTDIIVEIADQINLLSLNASIEAARAGDQGRGFAVVADEIGKLAYRTSESIKEIEQVVSESDKITSESVTVISATAEMIRRMIADIEGSSGQIQKLNESIITEENYTEKIFEQMIVNIQLAKSIGIGTEDQKRAIISSSEAIQHLTSIVNNMVDDVHVLARTSKEILERAENLRSKTEMDV